MKTSEAIEHFGSVIKLAEALGVTPEAIYQWPEFPPQLRQYQIEVLTKRRLRAEVAA